MNKKLIFVVCLAVTLVFCLSIADAYAFDYGKSKGHYAGKKEGHHKSFGDKISKKACFILKNKDVLDLTDEQIKQIKELTLKAKKESIRKKAEIDIAALDMKSMMCGETIDTAEIGKLIDKKYDLKKEKAKSSLEAYAALKGILTKEQTEKLKGLYKKECKRGYKKDKSKQ